MRVAARLATIEREAAAARRVPEGGRLLAALAAEAVELDGAVGARLARRALRALGEDASALLSLALAGIGAGAYRRAAGFAERSLACAPDRGFLARGHCVAGVAYRFLGQVAAARHHYRRARHYNRGADRELEADVAHNLAGLAHFEGRGALAERHARRALELRAGGRPDRLAVERAGLAAILHGRGKRDEALELYQGALPALIAAFGRADHEVAHCLGNYAALLHERGEAAAARRAYRRALAIEERCLGSDHPEVANVLENLATLEYELGRVALALRHARRALALRTRNAPRSRDARACRELVELIQRRGVTGRAAGRR